MSHLEESATALAAATQGGEHDVLYLAAAKMAAVQARAELERLEAGIRARETELARCAALRAKGLDP